MKKYFYSNGKEKEGPLTLEELKRIELQPTTLIWYEGLDDWTPAGKIVELTSVLEPHSPIISMENSDVDLEISGAAEDIKETHNKQLRMYRDVGGWLLLLCVVLTIISPARALYNMITSYHDVSPLFNQFPRLLPLIIIDYVLSATLMIFSINAGSALWNIKPKAVRTAKNYLFMHLGYTMIAAFIPFSVGYPSSVNQVLISEVTGSTMQALFFFGIWYSYLSFSKRVKATYED